MTRGGREIGDGEAPFSFSLLVSSPREMRWWHLAPTPSAFFFFSFFFFLGGGDTTIATIKISMYNDGSVVSPRQVRQCV